MDTLDRLFAKIDKARKQTKTKNNDVDDSIDITKARNSWWQSARLTSSASSVQNSSELTGEMLHRALSRLRARLQRDDQQNKCIIHLPPHAESEEDEMGD